MNSQEIGIANEEEDGTHSFIPTNFGKVFPRAHQVLRMIAKMEFEKPKTTMDIPFWENTFNKIFNWKHQHDQKIVKKSIAFLYYLKKMNIESLTDPNMCSYIIDFYTFFLETNKIENEKDAEFEEWTFICPRTIYQYNNSIWSFLLRTKLFDIKMKDGFSNLRNKLKHIDAFGGRSSSVEPYTNEMIVQIFETYPEHGEYLVEKAMFLCRVPSPVRGSHLSKCSFGGAKFTHNLELNTLMFSSDSGKTGLTYLYITHYKKNPKYSVYPLMMKYLVNVAKRDGSFFKHFNKKTGKYEKDFVKRDYVLIRKKMERMYLQYAPADIFFEELTNTTLDKTLRYCNLNIKRGLNRYGDKSFRKLYASNNRSNPNLTDQQCAMEYWASIDVYINSYQIGQAEAQIDRQDKVMDHIFFLRNVVKRDFQRIENNRPVIQPSNINLPTRNPAVSVCTKENNRPVCTKENNRPEMNNTWKNDQHRAKPSTENEQKMEIRTAKRKRVDFDDEAFHENKKRKLMNSCMMTKEELEDHLKKSMNLLIEANSVEQRIPRRSTAVRKENFDFSEFKDFK